AGISAEDAFGARIGGESPSARNEVSANDGPGILVTGFGSDSLEFGNNHITDNAEDGVRISGGRRVTVWGGTIEFNGRYGIHVDRGEAVRLGVPTSSTDSLTTISDNFSGGILIRDDADNVRVSGSDIIRHIDEAGVTILESSNHIIGSRGANPLSLPNAINLNRVGVIIRGSSASNNSLEGNLIGLSRSAENASNVDSGVLIDQGAHHNVVGGETTQPGQGRGNVISGQRRQCGGSAGILNKPGVKIDSDAGRGNRVEGNLIGLDATGGSAEANCIGVLVAGGDSTVVGGRGSGLRNIITANSFDNVLIRGGVGVRVEGNYIGLDVSGLQVFEIDAEHGIRIEGGSDHYVGGTVTRVGLAPGNVLSVKRGVGLLSSADRVTVQGNLIGTNSAGDGISIAPFEQALAFLFESATTFRSVARQEHKGISFPEISLDLHSGSSPSKPL
ncbi:MAG: right-handed parallel beta-helix repeat-containing protein, partial [Rhodothermales bacterium]|nr:right-handed parallel beta-helix repeat-containing protein [Rhodothermales bacterium]